MNDKIIKTSESFKYLVYGSQHDKSCVIYVKFRKFRILCGATDSVFM